MDQNKYLILLKGEDKTSSVASYKIHTSNVEILFKGKFKPHRYHIQNVIIEKNPDIIDIEKKSIYLNEIPIFQVTQVFNFGKKIKIFYQNGESQVFDAESIKFTNKESSDKTGLVERVLRYWTDISQYTKTDDKSEAFLKKEFDKLTFLHPESVLYSYLNKEPVKILSPSTSNIIFPFKFNLSQKKALENALKSNISIIEGPPGTGKTQTILNIIANLTMMQGKTVAIVSGNNAAVQNIKDKLEKEKYHFIVASLGNKENIKKFFEKLPQINVAGWESQLEERRLYEKITELNERINHLLEVNNQLAVVKQELSAFALEREHYERYSSHHKLEEIKRLPFYRQTPEKIISFLVDNHIAKEKEKLDSIFYKAKVLIKYGFTEFKKLKESEMGLILNLQKQYYDMKIRTLEEKKQELTNELANHSFQDLLKKHEELSTVIFKHKLYKKYNGKGNIDENTYKNNYKTFIDHFPIVLSTTHSLRNCVAENFLFDYLIIDEASQVDLLTAALSLSCSKNAIIVGDTKQLPQIVDLKIKDRINQIDIEDSFDYFKHNILSSMISLYENSISKETLREHYRCHPKIIEFCNQKYYDGALIPFREEKEGDIPLILYRTAKGNHMRKVTHGEERGKFNQRELDVIVEEVMQNHQLCFQSKTDIGFTTPYKKQVKKALNLLDDEIECDTIHKYQGREKSVMIMSTVLDTTFQGKKGISFVDDPCMINVAVSRAQNQFVLVTDNHLFSQFGKEVIDLIRYIEYSTLDENIIDSEIVSVFDLLYKEYSEKLMSYKNRLLNISKQQSEDIIWTLLNDILNESKYSSITCTYQVYLKNLIKSTDNLDSVEQAFVNHNASVDFVVYRKLNKQPVLIIEVDGFAFHENNPEQLKKDELKNNILRKYQLPLLRLPTTGSNEERKIRSRLDEVL